MVQHSIYFYPGELSANMSDCSGEHKSQMAKVNDNRKEGLTVGKRSKQHPETAETARFIGPHPHNSHTGVQHDVISYCATKLGLQRNHTSLYCQRRCRCVVSPTPRSVGQLLRVYETGRGKRWSDRCRSKVKKNDQHCVTFKSSMALLPS